MSTISYKARVNGGSTLISFIKKDSVLPLAESNHDTITTTPNVFDNSCGLIRQFNMEWHVWQACLKVSKRLPTFEYSDIVAELERVDWRANDESIHRRIRYLLEKNLLVRYNRGVYGIKV